MNASQLLVGLLLAPALLRAQGAPVPDDDSAGKARARYFLEPRRYPTGRVPVDAYRRAVEQLRQTRFAKPSAAMAAIVGGWQSIGPQRIQTGTQFVSGRVNDVATDPTDPSTAYVASASGGAWGTHDGGATWSPLSDGECTLFTQSISVDPSDHKVLYLGTGFFPYYYGCGLLRSRDGGATWANLSPSEFVAPWMEGSVSIIKLVTVQGPSHTSSDTRVYAATTAGIFVSFDGGDSWTHPVDSGWWYPSTGLVVDPNDPLVLYAEVLDDYAAVPGWLGFKTVDGGRTWARLPTFPSYPTSGAVGFNSLAISHSNPAVVYVFGCCGAASGMARSSDGGETWTQPSSWSPSPLYSWDATSLAVDPADPGHVFFGAVYLYESRDSARTFSPIATGLHVDFRALTFDPAHPGTLYTGEDGGVYRSSDLGATWTDLNSNLVLTEFYPGIAVSYARPSHILGGSQDNALDEYGGSTTWNFASNGGDGGYAAIDFSNDGRVFGEVQWGGSYSGPQRRDFGGVFQQKISGINLGDNASFIPPLVMDPSDPNVLYFGTTVLYSSGSAGDAWSPVSPLVPKTSSGTINTVAVSPVAPRTIWVGTSDGNVQVTTDRGATWSLVIAGLPNRAVTYIAASPNDSTSAYLTMSGFGAGHVFVTHDVGQQWQDITGDLPDVPADAVRLIPINGNQLLVGTDMGLFSSGSGGGVWTPLMPGQNFIVTDIAYDVPSGTVAVGTYGRGMYTEVFPTGLSLRGDVNQDGVVGAVDAQAVLRAELGLPLPSGMTAFPSGDADCDGKLTAKDAQVILSAAVGLDVRALCVGTFR